MVELDIYVGIGSVVLGFLGFGGAGLAVLYLVGKREGWSASSIVTSASLALLMWGGYQVAIFLRFLTEYVFTLPVYKVFSLSLDAMGTKLTDNPFMFGLNPLGYLIGSPVQALVTWAVEIISAFIAIYLIGPYITD